MLHFESSVNTISIEELYKELRGVISEIGEIPLSCNQSYFNIDMLGRKAYSALLDGMSVSGFGGDCFDFICWICTKMIASKTGFGYSDSHIISLLEKKSPESRCTLRLFLKDPDYLLDALGKNALSKEDEYRREKLAVEVYRVWYRINRKETLSTC